MDYMFEGNVTTTPKGDKTQVQITLERDSTQRIACYILPPMSELVHPHWLSKEARAIRDKDHVQPSALLPIAIQGKRPVQVTWKFEVETALPTILIIHAWSDEHGNEEWQLPYLLLNGLVINLHMPLDYVNLRGETWIDLLSLKP
jgi:hypothetical protein